MRRQRTSRARGIRGAFRRIARAATPVWCYYAYDPREQRTRLPGPLRAQVQTIDRCNGGCVMCPYTGNRGPATRMDDDLYEQILQQLAEAGGLRLFAPILQNEPLLDAGLAQRVRMARRILGPRRRITLVTNGSLLSEDRVRALVDAGVNLIAVSIDAYTRETYEAIRPGLDFDRVRANTIALLRYRDRIGIQARFLVQRTNRGQEQAFRRYWRSRGAIVAVHETTNRAATLEGHPDVYARGPRHWRDVVDKLARTLGGRFYPGCTLPFISLAVLADGRAIVCCHDWGPAQVVGDLSRQSLTEVWNGPEMNGVRQLIHERRFERSPACRGCSVVLTGDRCAPPA